MNVKANYYHNEFCKPMIKMEKMLYTNNNEINKLICLNIFFLNLIILRQSGYSLGKNQMLLENVQNYYSHRIFFLRCNLFELQLVHISVGLIHWCVVS